MAKILLIEDNRDLRDNTVELLELEGFSVDFAVDGVQGIELAKSSLPDLILCDIMMPGTTGYEVLTQIREHAPTSKTPFVFVTASVEKRDVEAALKLGANGYVHKPFETEVLVAEINRCITSTA